MLNEPSAQKGNTYTVDFDSTLGMSVKNYIQRCQLAHEAADDFVKNLHLKYKFIELTHDDTLHFSDDCDAGGLLYISISNERLSQLAQSPSSTPDYVMWASLPDPDDSSRTIWFPRIEVKTQYIRFGQAVKLFKSKDKSWEFQKDPQCSSSIKVFNFGDIVKRISPENRRALYDAKGNEPSHATRLALGCHYYLSTDDGNASFYAHKDMFNEALDLYKAWNDLPRVSANSLSRILALEIPEKIKCISRKDSHKFADELSRISFCHWRTDNERQQYIIHTGLISRLSDMHLVDNPE